LKIGDRLKLTRLKKEMTQEEVAEGIISVSYLSKIENNQVTPSEEVLHLLYQRLEIDNLFNERMNELMKQMMLWYKAITDKNEWKAVEMYENIKKMIEYFNDAEANTYFLLMEMRYYLFMKNISAAEAAMMQIRELYNTFDHEMKYYYYKFVGLLYYCIEKYEEALEYYKKAEELFRLQSFPKWEEADLYYLLSLAYSRLWKMLSCINYVQCALAIYQADYNLKRSAECHVLLGICYRRYGEVDKALEYYSLAQKAAQMVNDIELLGIIEHNLGYLKSMMKEYREAIQHYENSLVYKRQAMLADRFITLFSLIKEYYSSQNYRKALAIVEESLQLLRQHSDYTSSEYYFHFTVYQYLLSNNVSERDFEMFMKNEVLPYFQKHKKYEDVAQYAEYLADYYERCRKYKLASKYYKMSYEFLKKIIHI
jgi:HTH-type transcriptional regulator, quorum sensing regulator NprR